MRHKEAPLSSAVAARVANRSASRLRASQIHVASAILTSLKKEKFKKKRSDFIETLSLFFFLFFPDSLRFPFLCLYTEESFAQVIS
jgi:hypothetical protein